MTITRSGQIGVTRRGSTREGRDRPPLPRRAGSPDSPSKGAVPIALELLDRTTVVPRALPRVPGAGRGASRRSWLLGGAAVLLVAVVLLASPLVGVEAIGESLRSASLGLRVLVTSSWPWLIVLSGVAVLHYVLAAVALRAAAGTGWGVRVGEATKVQLVAAAANRITPSGLGAAAVNARHLSQCGQTASRSVGSIGAMNLVKGLANGSLLLLLAGLGALLGRPGEAQAGPDGGVWHLIPSPSAVPPAAWIGGGALLALLAGVTLGTRSRAGRVLTRVREVVGQAVEQITSLRRRPKDLAVLFVASGGTTLMMGLGLVVSVAAVARLDGVGGVSAILLGYLVGAAVGSAVPVPSGIGSTEAALVAVLAATGLPVASALSAVLLFRAVTFWAPVPVGLLLAPSLRRRGAL